MKAIVLTTVLLITSGCAGMAFDAAKRGDIVAAEKYAEQAGLPPDEVKELNRLACNKYNYWATVDPSALMLVAKCYFDCKSDSYCDNVKGTRTVWTAARYGVSLAQTELARGGLPVPPADLAANWETHRHNEAEELLLSQIASELSNH